MKSYSKLGGVGGEQVWRKADSSPKSEAIIRWWKGGRNRWAQDPESTKMGHTVVTRRLYSQNPWIDFCFTSSRLLNLSVPQGCHPGKAQKSKCDTRQAPQAVPIPWWELNTCCYSRYYTCINFRCWSVAAHSSWVIRESREPALSLPVLVLKFPHQIPSLDRKAMETDSIIKMTT